MLRRVMAQSRQSLYKADTVLKTPEHAE